MGVCIAASKKNDNKNKRSRSEPRPDSPVDLAEAPIESYRKKRIESRTSTGFL